MELMRTKTCPREWQQQERKQGRSKFSFSTETSQRKTNKQNEKNRTNFVETLKNNQIFTTKQIPNQEKAIFKMVGSFF
jgi:hypothetical protein